MPEDEMDPKVAYRMVKDELALDGNPVLNLASFVTTYMEEEAEQLMFESMSKNYIDLDEYPQTAELHNRCVNMLARLFHAPQQKPTNKALGCGTVGSSEAIFLAVIAMKRRWQQARKTAGKSHPTSTPNLVMCSNVQVCWEKAIEYLDIEARYVHITEDRFTMCLHQAVELCDENTIGVAAILGSTFTGHYDDISLLDSLLTRKCEETNGNVNVPIHVDAASGGFVAPFICPELVWDFRLERVVSINVSGHKYGLCYPGIGWALWRSSDHLPSSLIFHISYLGSRDQSSFTLNFSKPAAHVIAQYYNLVRLGKAGYRAIMLNLMDVRGFLVDEVEKIGRRRSAAEEGSDDDHDDDGSGGGGLFRVLSAKDEKGLPLVAFSLIKKQSTTQPDQEYIGRSQEFDEFDISHKLREKGWIVPAYCMPADAQKISVLRVVIREDFSRPRCELFVKALSEVVEILQDMDEGAVASERRDLSRSKGGTAAMVNKTRAIC